MEIHMKLPSGIVLRTFYLTPEHDKRITEIAGSVGKTKGEIFRQLIDLRRSRTGIGVQDQSERRSLVMRTFRVGEEDYLNLASRAAANGLDVNRLVRQLLDEALQNYK